jgi:enoyl-CoA hydratase/carnithine racemase
MNGGAERLVRDGDIVVREQGVLRRITLNRPQALNALTLEMATTVLAQLRAWRDDAAAGAVLIDGAGERALCAGGDLRALYDAAKFGDDLPARFWATEYRLDLLIARYPKPVIAVMDGLVMGGGVGISAHAAHRVVTERSAVAMPEVSIGYFPDVGASFLLARAPGRVGFHLGLTGERIGAADAIYAGLADVHIPSPKLAELPATLAGCRTAAAVKACLDRMSAPAAAGKLAAARPWIDACYRADKVEDIFERLHTSTGVEAQATLATLQKMSPTSLKITLRNICSALSFDKVQRSFEQDYRLSLACIAAHDFIEGIRAAIVDKDRKPVWQPDRLEDVSAAIVDRHFEPIGERELKLDE